MLIAFLRIHSYSATDIHTVTRHASYNHQSRQSDSPLLTYVSNILFFTNAYLNIDNVLH